MVKPLGGKSAIVTAGGGAIGSATTRLLVADGAHVLISGRTAAKLERVVDELSDVAKAAGGSIGYHAGSSLDEDVMRALVERAGQATGSVDIAVNVVGGGGGGTAPILRYSVRPPAPEDRGDMTDLVLYAGEGVDAINDIPPAGQLVRRLWEECLAAA